MVRLLKLQRNKEKKLPIRQNQQLHKSVSLGSSLLLDGDPIRALSPSFIAVQPPILAHPFLHRTPRGVTWSERAERSPGGVYTPPPVPCLQADGAALAPSTARGQPCEGPFAAPLPRRCPGPPPLLPPGRRRQPSPPACVPTAEQTLRLCCLPSHVFLPITRERLPALARQLPPGSQPGRGKQDAEPTSRHTWLIMDISRKCD